MSDEYAAFIGSVPENYDRYLGPVLFEPYAEDIAARLNLSKVHSVLELACGTGILTRKLRDRLPSNVRLVATDLNEPMMSYAARKIGLDKTIEWQLADADALPFPDESFETVVCQFGLMFAPDKEIAVRETFRVLKPGGTFHFSVWDGIELNDLANIAHTTIAKFFEHEPPNFYEIPFCLKDPEVVRLLLKSAGFSDIEISYLKLPSVSPTALDVAKGLIEGNPVIGAIHERWPSGVPMIIGTLADAIASRYGDLPVKASMQALVCKAMR